MDYPANTLCPRQDLTIILISPEGDEVILTKNLGGTGSNYTNTVFDSESTNPIQSGGPPFTGIYKPIGNLKDLYNLNSGGEWTLRIIDQYPVCLLYTSPSPRDS